MSFKVGDKVRVREDLVVGERYGGREYTKRMEVHAGKTFIVNEILYHNETCTLKGACPSYFYSMDMLEPAEFTVDDLQVNDIVTVREGDMYMIHELKNELFAIAYDEYNELKNYKDDFKEVDGLTDLDIVCIRRPEEPWQLERRCWEDAPIIWEEKKEPYDGKSFEELFKQQWGWLADNPGKDKKDWFNEFYPNEKRPIGNCFACQSTTYNDDGVIDCKKCPICNRKENEKCLNGLYDAWFIANEWEQWEIARAIANSIANLEWREK